VPKEAPSVRPEYLRKSFYIMKNAVIEFDYGNSDKTYFTARIENSGKKGKRKPPVQALIP
jgi:hypothetical protein